MHPTRLAAGRSGHREDVSSAANEKGEGVPSLTGRLTTVPMLLVLAAAMALAGCSSGGTGPTSSAGAPTTGTSASASQQPTTPARTATSPATGRTSRPATTMARPIEKLLVFVVENHSFDQMRNEMPYTRGLATRYGYADDYVAITHPSLPNYLAIAGGDTFGVSDDSPPSIHSLSGASVFGEAAKSGSTAKLYAEAMTSPCQQESSGTYAVKHNPWAYFVDERSLCQRADVPLEDLDNDISTGGLPAVGMVIPDLCNDAHDCSLARADAWMRRYVGDVLAGPDWASGHLAVIVTADEDDNHHDNKILTVVMHPALRHDVVHSRLDHYALSRSYAEVAGVQPLRKAEGAPSLLSRFGLGVD
jgi:phospholipase C